MLRRGETEGVLWARNQAGMIWLLEVWLVYCYNADLVGLCLLRVFQYLSPIYILLPSLQSRSHMFRVDERDPSEGVIEQLAACNIFQHRNSPSSRT